MRAKSLQSCRFFETPLYPTRPLCPWESPGKNTGVGCHFLLAGISPTQGSTLCLLHCRQILHTEPPGKHGDALMPSPSSYPTRHHLPRATAALSSITKVSSSCFGTSHKWSDVTTTFSEVRKILINILTRRALGMHASKQQTGSLHSGRRCCLETAGHSEMLRGDKSKTDL